MAVLKGPLMSIDARGQFAKSMVFGGWKGIQWARMYFIPQNPNTDDQKAIRLIFTQAVSKWQDQVAPNTDNWQVAADATGKTLSGFNFFVSEYINSMRAGQTPSTTPPAHLLP